MRDFLWHAIRYYLNLKSKLIFSISITIPFSFSLVQSHTHERLTLNDYLKEQIICDLSIQLQLKRGNNMYRFPCIFPGAYILPYLLYEYFVELEFAIRFKVD